MSMNEHQDLKELPQKLILIVEDDANLVRLLTYTLARRTTYKIVIASNAASALALLKTLCPDLIILDYFLPDGNGIHLYDYLQTQQGLQSIPTIIMSSTLPRTEIKVRNLKGLQKPFSMDEFLHEIKQALS